MFTPLQAAIADQYAAFNAPRPHVIQGCSCCTSAAELAALTAAPREALGAAQLDFYASKAITTVGTVDDFRYYWPRLAELTIGDRFLTDTEIVLAKPLYGGHHTWPAPERAALVRLAAALGERFAVEEIEAGDLDMWVCAIGLLSEHLEDITTVLSPLFSNAPIARANLGAFADWNRKPIETKGRLSNAFWEYAPAGASRLLDRLKNPSGERTLR